MDKYKSIETRDNHIGVPLTKIYPISERGYSLFARNKKQLKIKVDEEVIIVGAIHMLEALDYHYNNFLSLKNSSNEKNLIHEVIAYINRVGQFFSFANSKFCKNYNLTKKDISKMESLLLFRHKGTSKRNIDLKNSDSKDVKWGQAFLF